MKKQVNITTLDNGLKVITDRIDHVESVAMGCWVDIGARYESVEENGVAHMLEHMAFKGTTTRSAKQIAEAIENVGGEMNAYTSYESTAYHLRLLKEDLPLGIDILGDILSNSTFDAEEFEKERGVILQEIGMYQDSPDDVAFDLFQQTLYPDQPLGRPILGTTDVIRTLTPHHVKSYMQTHYSSNRMIFAAAGKLEHEHVVEHVQKALGGFQKRDTTAFSKAIYQGGDKRQEKELEQAHVLVGFEGLAFNDPDFYTAMTLSTILGGGMSSRLFQEVREKRGLVYSIYSYHSSYRDTGVFGIYAGTGPDKVRDLLSVVAEQIQSVCHTLGDEEIVRAKAQIKSGLMMALESTSARCRQLASHMMIYGHPIAPEEILSQINAIDAKSLTDVASRIFSQTSTLTGFGPIQELESYEEWCARLS